jgi:hypothetical protein
MNSKTTLLLFLAVVAVGSAIYVLQEKAPPPLPALETPAPDPSQAVQKPVLAEDLGEVTEIQVQQPDQPAWRFVKEAAPADAKPAEGMPPQGDWKLVEPLEGRTQKWQIDQIARRLTELKYSAKFEAGNAAMSAAEAGLDSPRAAITLVGKDGKKHTVHLGRNEGDSDTYVRVDDSPTIYQAQPSLKGLLRAKPLEYLDNQLFSVPADKIVRIAIDSPLEGGAKEHVELVKSGGQWVFEQPSAGKTMPDKISRLASTFGTLRAVKWVEQAADPGVFGLGDDALTVTATVEEQPPAPTAADAAATPAPAPPEIKKYTVRFSKNTPLGVADTFRPNMKEWRDNRLFERDPTTARRVEISVGDAKAAFVRGQAEWTQEGTNTPADRTEMAAFLAALRGTTALNFEEGVAADPAKFGLDAPQAVISLTFDGQNEPLHVAVGGYADPETKRLMYVRVGDKDSVAKLRVADAQALIRQPGSFRDRAVLSVPADRLKKVEVERTEAHGLDPNARVSLAVVQEDGKWKMTAPVESDANSNGIAALVGALANLRGSRVIDVAEGAGLAEYGLDSPSATVSVTYGSSQPADQDSNGEAARTDSSETITLSLARRDQNAFAMRGDNDRVVYALDPAAFDALTGELRDGKILRYEEVMVSSVLVEQGGKTQGFKKTGNVWTFVPEADIPVDSAKIVNFLLRIKDLRALHYVAYGVTEFAPFGLDAPAVTLRIEDDGKPIPTLLVSSKANAQGELFARIEGVNEVFVLPADALPRLKIDIAEFEKSAAAAAAPPPRPQGPRPPIGN